MNQNCSGFFQKSRLRCRTIWARAVPKKQGKSGPIREYPIQEWIRCDNKPFRRKTGEAIGTCT